MKTLKKCPQKLPNFFVCCQPAQNQPKSQFMFHKKCLLRDLCIMTLVQSVSALMAVKYFK